MCCEIFLSFPIVIPCVFYSRRTFWKQNLFLRCRISSKMNFLCETEIVFKIYIIVTYYLCRFLVLALQWSISSNSGFCAGELKFSLVSKVLIILTYFLVLIVRTHILLLWSKIPCRVKLIPVFLPDVFAPSNSLSVLSTNVFWSTIYCKVKFVVWSRKKFSFVRPIFFAEFEELLEASVLINDLLYAEVLLWN